MIDRHQQLRTIMLDSKINTVRNLAEQLKVSQVTIRQDLTKLEGTGFLRRFHGGAVLNEMDDFSHCIGIKYQERIKIAKAAAEFVNEGETIYIDSGPINALFAKEVSQKHGVTIITSNTLIGRKIGKEASIKLILLGGLYQPKSECLVGNLVKRCLEMLNFSKAFIEVDGFTIEAGFTCGDMMQADIKKHVIHHSPESFLLADSSKFGEIALSSFCGPDDIEFLITDSRLGQDYRDHMSASNVPIVFAE